MEKMERFGQMVWMWLRTGGVGAVGGGACRMEVWCLSLSIQRQLDNERQEVHVWHDYGQEEENPQSLVQPSSGLGVPPVAEAAQRTQM